MRILQLISSSGFFGAENVVLELALGIAGLGKHHAVVGVFKNEHALHLELAEECGRQGIETAIFSCRGKADPGTILSLRRYLHENKVDCLHSHGYKADIYSMLATAGMGTFRIATCHNWLGDEPKMRLYASLDRWFLRRFDRVVAVSEEVRGKVEKAGVKPDRVRLIRNGVRLDRFGEMDGRAGAKEALGIAGESLVVGTVGRLSEEKGHRKLLRVARGIREAYPNVIFLLIGDGPLRKDLELEFASPGVVFTGLRKNVADLYGCMDIFVLPSLTEGLPMALLEAMASSLPVVATAVGEVPEVLKGGCGLLVEAGAEDDLRRALVRLLERPEERRTMGKEGARRAREGFASDRMVESYLQVYEGAGCGAAHTA
jgi:glycosyltransferase involved in cell wall biosynthesis